MFWRTPPPLPIAYNTMGMLNLNPFLGNTDRLIPGCPDGIPRAKNASCLQIFYLTEPVTLNFVQIFN